MFPKIIIIFNIKNYKRQKIMKKSTEELMNILEKNKNIEKYLDTYVEENKDEFISQKLSDHLNKLLEEKGLKKSDIVKAPGLDSSYAYQIFNGTKENPSRDMLIMLAIAMELDIEETQRLLKIGNAGALYPRNKRDSIIIYAINSKLTFMECDELLYDMKEKTLSNKSG